MYRKRIILILTSRDEPDNVSQKLAEAIRKIGTHNVVVMSDDRYGSATKLSALDRLMDSGGEYQYLLEKKDKSILKEKFGFKSLSKRVNRINNLIKRFHPEYILCVTPYAHHCATEAKRRARFDTQIIYLMNTFCLPKRIHDNTTSVYIVENPEIKTALVQKGIKSKDVMVMGLPFEAQSISKDEAEQKKRELGLPKVKTVYLGISDKKKLQKAYSLLLDQGEIANLAVYCDDQKLLPALSSMAVKVPEMKVVFIQDKDRIGEYLQISDVAVVEYDVATIYKCMKLGVPSIVFSANEHEQADLGFLVSHNLCLNAKEDIEIVALLYKVLQTGVGDYISQNAKNWVEMSSIDNIAAFLSTYIAV